MPLPWPNRYNCVKGPIHKAAAAIRPFLILREYSAEKAEAKIYLAEIDAIGYQGHALLKLDTVAHRFKRQKTEAQLHEQAEKNAFLFARKHLPKLICVTEKDGKTAALYAIEGLDYTNVQPLLMLHADQQKAAIQRLCPGLLKEWNYDYRLSDLPLTPQAILKKWLKDKPGTDDGTLRNFLEKATGSEQDAPAFSFRGIWFPNPYAYFCTSNNLWNAGHAIVPVKGRAHGDLHSCNALIKIRKYDPYQYFLINLALYEENSFLFYDHAFLELSYFLHYCRLYSLTRWLQILDVLKNWKDGGLEIKGVEPEDAEILSVIAVLRGEITNWIGTCESGNKSHMEGQNLLARVAAGLDFMGRKIDPRLKQLSLLYSATNLRLYLDRFGINWKKEGAALAFNEIVIPPAIDEWRKVWNRADRFDDRENSYMLICGEGVRNCKPEEISSLGQVKWSQIIDLDPHSKQDGLLHAAGPVLLKYRAIRTITDEIPQINYHKATAWLMAAAPAGNKDSVRKNPTDWRCGCLPVIGELSRHLKINVAPRPLVALILASGLEKTALKNIWEKIDEVYGDSARAVIVYEENRQSELAEEFKSCPNVSLIKCHLRDFLSGLRQIFGLPVDTKIAVPVRAAANSRKLTEMSDEKSRYFSEDLEIIYQGLARQIDADVRAGADFYRGNEITWSELEMNADIPRAMTPTLKAAIRKALDQSHGVPVFLEHYPGSGATTISKRIAWELKHEYPVVRLLHFSNNTIDRLEALFQETQLPVLVVADDSKLPPAAGKKIRQGLKQRNVRAVLFLLLRNTRPSSEFSLRKIMTPNEAKHFGTLYKSLVPADRHTALDRWVQDQNCRLPYFFNLCAFGKEFERVSDFVRQHLVYLTEKTGKFLCFLSLLSRYSQSHLPDSVIKKWLKILSHDPLNLQDLFNPQTARLILYRNRFLAVIHPVIAEEILRQLLSDNHQAGAEEWKTRLADACISFIDWMVGICGKDSKLVRDIILQLFVYKNPLQESINPRETLPELIQEMPGAESQNKVLEKIAKLIGQG